MSLIARHKKPGGFEHLVQQLEVTSPDKRNKIIASLEPEDPVFMDRVKRSMLTFAELKSLKEDILMEIIYIAEKMQYIAMALYKLEDKEMVDKFLKCIPPKQMVDYREAAEMLNKVTSGQREGAQFKLVQCARQLQNEKGIKIKPFILE